MANAVVRASKAARKATKKLSGFSAVISRNGETSSSIRVTFGETQIDELVANETVITTRLRDLIIDIDDYVIPAISASPLTPEGGDRITVTLKSGVTVFEVIPNDNSREARRHDRYGNTWRVHTKELSNAAGL